MITDPSIADAAVLTGQSYAQQRGYVDLFVTSQASRIASHLSPKKWAYFDTGYITFADIYAHVATFFKAPGYEFEAVKYAQSIAAPAAIAEFLSFTADPRAPEFKGPVLVNTGEFDLPFCSGECYSTFAEQKLDGDDGVFPKSRMVEAFVQPGAAHGVNFATNATGFYGAISDFLDRAGF